VIAACVWIGGQIVIAVVIPLLRRVDGLTVAAGRRYQAVAWPAFGVLIATGIANIHILGISWSALITSAFGRTLIIKLGFVLLSGGAAGVHALIQAPRIRSASVAHPVTSALLGGISLLAAVAAALFEVVIARSRLRVVHVDELIPGHGGVHHAQALEPEIQARIKEQVSELIADGLMRSTRGGLFVTSLSAV
jgi:putative copper export protein